MVIQANGVFQHAEEDPNREAGEHLTKRPPGG